MRTHLCGEVTEKLDGQTVELCGWVDARRDLGGLIFIGLRDRAGIVQVVAEPDSPAFADAETLRKEYCVKITGTVRLRPESQWNENMVTGRVEVVATAVEVLQYGQREGRRLAGAGLGAADQVTARQHHR